jgi:hypothetical protein
MYLDMYPNTYRVFSQAGFGPHRGGITIGEGRGWSSGTYYSRSVAQSGINKSGGSKYTLVSNRDVDGNQPSGAEYVYVVLADQSGTSSDPYLAVTAVATRYACVI